jgi:hypothetical protein
VHVFWGEIKDRYRHIEFEEREGNRGWRSWGGIGVLDWSGEQIPRDTDSDPEAIELFITEEDAKRALEDCLRDEPQWRGRLKVTEVELDHQHTSLN